MQNKPTIELYDHTYNYSGPKPSVRFIYLQEVIRIDTQMPKPYETTRLILKSQTGETLQITY